MNNHNRLRVALAVLSGRMTTETITEADAKWLCPQGFICENHMRIKAECVLFDYLTKKETVSA